MYQGLLQVLGKQHWVLQSSPPCWCPKYINAGVKARQRASSRQRASGRECIDTEDEIMH